MRSVKLKRPLARSLAEGERWAKNLIGEAQNRAHLKLLRECGPDVRINGRINMTGHENAVFEANVHIGDGAFIRAAGGLHIGANTHISRDLLLYTINHDYYGDRLPYDEKIDQRAVIIGRNVWIGMSVRIVPGTTIGDGAIIGMGTVVSGSVPSMAIIGSESWRVLGWRDESHYRRLDGNEVYGGVSGRPYVSSGSQASGDHPRRLR